MKFKNFYDGLMILTRYAVNYDEEEVMGLDDLVVVHLTLEPTEEDQKRLRSLGWSKALGSNKPAWIA